MIILPDCMALYTVLELLVTTPLVKTKLLGKHLTTDVFHLDAKAYFSY